MASHLKLKVGGKDLKSTQTYPGQLGLKASCLRPVIAVLLKKITYPLITPNLTSGNLGRGAGGGCHWGLRSRPSHWASFRSRGRFP